ncbi:MAG: terminase family protein [Pseudomonadota bacterium]
MIDDFPLWARSEQLPPEGDWTTWMLLGGRAAGKTRAGAEWVRGIATGNPVYGSPATAPIALIGETFAAVRDVMIDGVSGLLAIHAADERPTWEKTRARLVWPNGLTAQAFSAEDPEALRGPQFAAAWCDEVGKWRRAEAVWDMLQFGLRLGARPRQVVTTTPRPTPLIRRLVDDPRTVVTRMRSIDNAANLAPGFFDAIVGRYDGTRLGRQELDGELVEDRPDALFRRETIERHRTSGQFDAFGLGRIVIAVDPPVSSSAKADACGIVAAGLASDGMVLVLADRTVAAAKPLDWARRVVTLYHALSADAVVAEVNQGGEMVATILHQIDPDLPVRPVRAKRGKWLRAEPVAALYEQGRVRHLGLFPELEDELCDFGPDGVSDGRSPDRVDALVWAVTALTGFDRDPRLRMI